MGKRKIHFPRTDRNPTGKPNPAQLRYIKVMKKFPLSLFSGGVGSGKTTTVGGYCANYLAARNPNTNGMLVAHDWNTLRNVVLPMFLRFLPKNHLIKHYKQDNVLKLTHNRLIYLASARNPDSLEAKTIGWGAGDELRYWPRSSFVRFIGRGRGVAPFPRYIFSSTPSMNWMWSEFVQKKEHGVVFASTLENAANVGEQFIANLKHRFSKKLYESYVLGRFIHMTGGVFESYDPDIHVEYGLYSRSLPVHCSIDFGKNMPAVLFFQHLHYCDRHRCNDCIHVIDEMIPDQMPTLKLAPQIKKYYDRKRWTLGTVYCDPAGRAGDQTTGMNSLHIIRMTLGRKPVFTLNPIETFIPNGIELINSRLEPIEGRPALFFESALAGKSDRGIINSLLQSVYPTNKEGIVISDHPLKDGKFDHIRDCLRYALVNLLAVPSASFRAR